jgi:hypothetical protein
VALPTLCLLRAVPYLCVLGAGLACSRSLDSNEATFDDIVGESSECQDDDTCFSSSHDGSMPTSNAAASGSEDAGASGTEISDDASQAPNPTLPETTSAISEELSDGASQDPPDAGPPSTPNPTEPVASGPEASTPDLR